MTEIVRGFDSRSTTSIPADTDYKFAGIKVSESIGQGPYPEPRWQWQRCGELGLARLPFHFWRAGRTGDPVRHGQDQAEWFFKLYTQHFKPFGANELPPCIDAEDIYATPGLHALNNLVACLKRTEDLWGIPRYSALLYTAGWWFDVRIKPYTTPGHEIYNWKLWEADPPPDTPVGYWREEDSVIRQVRLDFMIPGFNADVDEDWARTDWYLQQLGENPPGGQPFQAEVVVPPTFAGRDIVVTIKQG